MTNSDDVSINPALGGRAPEKLALGAAGELLVASRFALLGYQVYRPLADDRGIDLVVDLSYGRHFMVQVKSTKDTKPVSGYPFAQERNFTLAPWLAMAIVMFGSSLDTDPDVFLIPSIAWADPLPTDGPLRHHLYDKPGQSSKAEYAVNLRANWKEDLKDWRWSTDHVAQVLQSAIT